MNQRVGCFYRHFRCENVPAYGPAGRGRAVKWYRGCDMLTVAATRLWAVRRVPGRPGSGSTCGRAEGTYAVVQNVNVRVDVALMAVHRCGQAFSFNRPFGQAGFRPRGHRPLYGCGGTWWKGEMMRIRLTGRVAGGEEVVETAAGQPTGLNGGDDECHR